MTGLKTSIKTITYLSDIGCLEIQGASLVILTLHLRTALYLKLTMSAAAGIPSGSDIPARCAGGFHCNA
ncbi:hypothetical protein EAN99_28310 [Klebsiella pneumoniae]|nr:hypothetical protein EAN99_28310 [Klebsiella pneumoniae]